ncbi:fibrobacter succinogenes major paralogous domain-containing protein [Natronoflexus pectinivorans]|uniref:Uncharacterized protein (TIGR02145 family) n=1 Tax=Natronoflexus pectinivorans TaxID=682526 RepID=A0A4V2RX10_9BACT|nr:fibrobacter succinogenes major paralogous domain-containing protein [Natronoflexus pectinivorans]TCO10991.1 uncharacterized protein (TIGR02145 family) [Natronoflexus pectinivorans]
MKYIINSTIFISILLVFAGCKKETTSPENFTASRGTHVGVINLAFSEAHGHGEMHFDVERFNEDNATWESIAWTKQRSFGDYGINLPNNIIPGKEYRYRMRAHSHDGGYGKYTPEATGYAFEATPVQIVSLETTADLFQKSTEITWQDTNNYNDLRNLFNISYTILRAKSNELESFEHVHTKQVGGIPNTKEFYSFFDTYNLDQSYVYRITARYGYQYTDRDGSLQDRLYSVEGPTYGISGDNGNGDNNGNGGLPGEGVTDAEGNNYQTIIIGSQEWMAENLRTTKYNDGTPINDVDTWNTSTTGNYAWYNDDSGYQNPFGALYNWQAVETGKLCPDGWRVPTNSDWQELENHLGGAAVAGGKLKATSYWDAPNEGATNSSGFTALPGGEKYEGGAYMEMGNQGFWWSATEVSGNQAYARRLHSHFGSIQTNEAAKSNGYSVRCIKN